MLSFAMYGEANSDWTLSPEMLDIVESLLTELRVQLPKHQPKLAMILSKIIVSLECELDEERVQRSIDYANYRIQQEAK